MCIRDRDLIVAAVNEAEKIVEETTEQEMEELTGGINIPGML